MKGYFRNERIARVERALTKFLTACDEGLSLEEHDRKYHPDGYKPGDTCNLRDKLGQEAAPDNLGGGNETIPPPNPPIDANGNPTEGQGEGNGMPTAEATKELCDSINALDDSPELEGVRNALSEVSDAYAGMEADKSQASTVIEKAKNYFDQVKATLSDLVTGDEDKTWLSTCVGIGGMATSLIAGLAICGNEAGAQNPLVISGIVGGMAQAGLSTASVLINSLRMGGPSKGEKLRRQLVDVERKMKAAEDNPDKYAKLDEKRKKIKAKWDEYYSFLDDNR